MSANTLFLRLEGQMQAWGDNESKLDIKRSYEAPTKSGVFGLLLSALGIPRPEAEKQWLPKLKEMVRMGVRIDEPGVRWWDYHTVGAGMQMRIAEGEDKTKVGPKLSRREYLCDASFLVALQSDKPEIIDELETAMKEPKWVIYLGRKCCPPSRPIIEYEPGNFSSMPIALATIPWRARFAGRNGPTRTLPCIIDLGSLDQKEIKSGKTQVWYDLPVHLDPPAHEPRLVVHIPIEAKVGNPTQQRTLGPPGPRANYGNEKYKACRRERLDRDHYLCVFCKSPATTVQHVTYRHAGGGERIDELRSLCRLCHDAVTMIEYGLGMGLDRINPEDPKWRDEIIKKRSEIIEFRSLETRRRSLKWGLKPEEVE